MWEKEKEEEEAEVEDKKEFMKKDIMLVVRNERNRDRVTGVDKILW